MFLVFTAMKTTHTAFLLRLEECFYNETGRNKKLIRVIALSNCLECKSCEKSCERRHNYQRNVRDGVRMGHLIIPYACKQCEDPQCAGACKKGAIKKDPSTDVLYLDKDLCIGCGLCAKKCSFGSILMEEKGDFRDMKDKEGNLTKIPIKYANRCDLCRGCKVKGCYANCPGGALRMFLPFNEVFRSLIPAYQEKLKKLFLNGHWVKEEQDRVHEQNANEDHKMVKV